MAARVDPTWKKSMEERMDKGLDINVSIAYHPATQWLIVQLSSRSIPYRLYQLGAGVKKIVTGDIEKCPCCKQKLK